MTLRLHNTLDRKKAEFAPLDPANVRMYVCGPTVYDVAHIGNARPVIVFDVLYRLLRHVYGAGNVTYVRNITDVDDKIIAASETTGEAIGAITARTTDQFHADMAALGALQPDQEPRATDHIPEMLELIQALLDKDHAYGREGHVLFDVTSMADYGRLSGHNRDELIAGARVEVAPYKKDPADFVLWKPSSDSQPGWASPWGFGRPGWHLECSAMSSKYLGRSFDIHAGGQDLIFPHHENEIAQSRSAHPDESFAQVWMHNGYLMVEGEKMSKSLGNFITVQDLLRQNHGETIRLAMLATHYRQPINWTADGLREAKERLDKFYYALKDAGHVQYFPVGPPPSVVNALSDDLNTPLALNQLREFASELWAFEDGPERASKKAELIAGAALLGLLQCDPEDWFKWQPQSADNGLSDADIDALIEARDKARANKEFAEADRIRDELAADGIVLEDGAGGTTWRRK
jgi:cysteinyl-tRNA synthetase